MKGRDSSTSLLVFDPSSDGSKIKASLEGDTQGWRHSLKRGACAVCAVCAVCVYRCALFRAARGAPTARPPLTPRAPPNPAQGRTR